MENIYVTMATILDTIKLPLYQVKNTQGIHKRRLKNTPQYALQPYILLVLYSFLLAVIFKKAVKRRTPLLPQTYSTYIDLLL
ncbi:MAG: hypothetical protein H7331_01225 [Bacteroidia bacterium]|nr:hypothetical protein [Bacteroidia bacterium]